MLVGVVDELRSTSPSSSSATGPPRRTAAWPTTASRSTSTAPIGRDLLHSFFVTVASTRCSWSACAWLFGLAARRAAATGRSAAAASLRTLFLVPYALPVYAAVITWSFMFQRDNGLVNHGAVGRPAPDATPRRSGCSAATASALVVIAAIWRLLAVRVPDARWPGCRASPASSTRRRRSTAPAFLAAARSITLPLLRPVNRVLLLVLFLWTFNDFNTPYMLFGPAPPKPAT